jgi:serine/threonine protein phosphatase PrpC
MLQRYIIYLERKNNICYYGNISTFFSILYYLSNKRHVIFVIILHKTINLNALKTADNAIATKGLAEYKCPMGTTIALAIVSDYQMFYTWQGNVRIYLKNDNGLSILTSDHILDVGYGHTRVTRCRKGTGLREDIPVRIAKLSRNDKVFFCTDGFYNIAESMLSNKSITEIKKAIINPDDDVSLIQVNI